jgi:Ca2+-transporting ATPase
MGFVAFGLMSIAIGVSARNETASSFNRNIISSRNQLLLYGIALLFVFLPTEMAFLQSFLGTTSLTGEQWLLAIVAAILLLLVDEVIKFFLRRSRS